jgi:hypothetical protein
MRYLKRFNESNNDDVIQTIKDILLPINDMGYNISVDHYILNGDTNQLIIRVVTYVDKPLLITDEVKEEFIRMKDYLQSEGYNSIEAHYYTRFNAVPDSPSNKDVKELDEFITVKDPIVNLLFNAKKKL